MTNENGNEKESSSGYQELNESEQIDPDEIYYLCTCCCNLITCILESPFIC